MNIREILQVKGKEAFTVLPTDSIAALSAKLRANKVGAAVVSRDGQSIDGVITERDVVYAIGVHGEGLHNMPVSDIMTEKVITCSPNDNVAHVASTMMGRTIRHIPVEENGKFLGMISIRDMLKERVDQLQQATAQLRKFVKEASREPQDRE
ncbi:MAG: CBS domain-containing protein [Hyphomicrobiaceae bacterium TMED74]|nr:histidine kinase [Filomicrobium sp.]RPG46889.1 MAG: CBS domain-containing protein [Hyphomicrobiaceae bacterium TMED74]